MRELTCELKEYIQPFERVLAIEELRALTADDPKPVGNKETALRFKIRTATAESLLLDQLAYWRSVGSTQQVLTSQLRSEATSVIARNGVALDELQITVPKIIDSKIPNRRCLRYATHGLHEYRGKFFPQLVRALINMGAVPEEGYVLDPMCGSGTTLVEAVLAGRKAVGLDMNPLSAFVTDTKCRALRVRAQMFVDAFNELSHATQKGNTKLTASGYFHSLSQVDKDYLEKWFSPSVLGELDHIYRCIQGLESNAVQSFFLVSLSNIIRGVSWQKEDDLRVRKDVRALQKGEVITRFINEASRAAKNIVAFISQRGRSGLGTHTVREADARVSAQKLSKLRGKIDAVITSPPYATALPYLDTDRLSLIYLGLLSRSEHRGRDTLMIGNREVTDRTRKTYWETFLETGSGLPPDTHLLINKIEKLNSEADVGFRRRNLAALLSKYFFDMQAVIQQQLDLLRPGGLMYMVVGNNRTTAGGEDIEIRTTDHLAKIAEGVGFRFVNTLPMEMLTSRDIFRKNAMPSEEIITLQKPQ